MFFFFSLSCHGNIIKYYFAFSFSTAHIKMYSSSNQGGNKNRYKCNKKEKAYKEQEALKNYDQPRPKVHEH